MLLQHMQSSRIRTRDRDPRSGDAASSFRPWRLPACTAVLAAVAVLFPRAEADAPPTETTRTLRSIQVALVGEAALDPVLGRRITSWFDVDAFRVEVQLEPRLDPERVLSAAPTTGARVWVMLRPQGARVY